MSKEDKGKTGGMVKRRKKKKSVLVIVTVNAVALVLLLGVMLAYMLTKKEPEREVQGRGTVVTEDNVEEIMQAGEQNTDASYTVSMTNEWTFEDGRASAEDFYVKNTENNSRTVYFDLQLRETGEEIYSSPYIPVGEAMDTFKLDKKLEAGDYNVIMTYHLVDDAKEELTTVY